MNKKSSGASAAQDIARVAATGKQGKESTSAGGSRRRIFRFSSIVVAVLILGVGLVTAAKLTRDFLPRPRQNDDHWHSAYGTWDCAANGGVGAFEPGFTSTNDPVGIHSHSDETIHVHPWFERASGNDATMSHFFEAMGVEVAPEAITMPDGRVLAAGVECGGEPSIITVRRWRDLNSLERDPIIYTENFGDIRFFDSGEAFVIARAPEGADVPPPRQSAIDGAKASSPDLISRPPIPLDTETQP